MSAVPEGQTAWVRSIGAAALVAVIAGVALFAGPQIAAPPTTQATPSPTPGTGSALILGQVVDAAGGGVANAVVTLSGGLMQSGGFAYNVTPAAIPGGARRTFTNSDGHFLFSNLAKGLYSIEASRPGYEVGAYGKVRPDGLAQSLELADGERNGSVKITIWKHAAITGRLVDDQSEPVVGAAVFAVKRSFATGRSQFMWAPSATTDDRGVFRIAGLTPGEYLVCVPSSQNSLPVSVVDSFAQARSNGTSAEFSRQLPSSATTLSLGSGIRMGEWVVSYSNYGRGLTPPGPDESGRPLSFQTTFYPAAINVSNAEVISLASGDERTGLDVHLRLVPTAPVIGTVTGPNGPVPFLGMRLAQEYATELGDESSFDAGTTVTDAEGRFGFPVVPVGRYVLRALKIPVPPSVSQPVRLSPGDTFPTPPPPPPIPQEPTLWANVPITVGPDGLPDLNLRLSTGFRISGRFVFDGQSAKPPGTVVQTMYMLAQPADGHQIGYAGALRGQTNPDGTFTSYEIPPGKYFIRMAAPTPSWQAMSGWLYASSVTGGRDVGGVAVDLRSDITDLVITMTDHPSEISGIVRDDSGRPDSKAMVLIYSANAVDWSNFGDTPRRIRSVRTSPTGTYRVPSLPPGPYFVAAVPDAQAGDWADPRVLQAISRTATRITLAENEKRTQELVTRTIR